MVTWVLRLFNFSGKCPATFFILYMKKLNSFNWYSDFNKNEQPEIFTKNEHLQILNENVDVFKKKVHHHKLSPFFY
jgi:hypothetical protein